jgi:hypothetical protein
MNFPIGADICMFSVGMLDIPMITYGVPLPSVAVDVFNSLITRQPLEFTRPWWNNVRMASINR